MISSKLLLVHQYFFLFHDIVCGEFFSLRFDVTTRVFLLESRRRRTEERERKNDCHLARVTCERVNERRGANNYSLRKFSLLLLLLLLLLPSFVLVFIRLHQSSWWCSRPSAYWVGDGSTRKTTASTSK